MYNGENQHQGLTEILIAEDSPTQAARLIYTLEKNNYKVVVAKDGKEALRLVHERKPSLIISDIQMPEMDGFEFCKQIKTNETTQDIPVILLTSLSASKDVLEGLACGADRFITKPSSESYLLSHVEKTLYEKVSSLNHHHKIELEVATNGKKQNVSVDPARVISLMLSTYEAAISKNKELTEAQNELIAFNNNLEELILERTAELVKTNAEKDKFLSIIAHDLRSPFNIFLGLTEVIKEEAETLSRSQFAQFGKMLHESAQKLFQLLENLLEWSQMHKGLVGFTPEKFNLFDLALKNIEIIKQSAEKKEISIVNSIEKKQEIYADEKMIDSVLRNLLSNAVKFTKRGGSITIDALPTKNDGIKIMVSDTGVGISETTISKLFSIGEKIGTPGTENEPSTGLGLLLCKEFIEKHNGTIQVESEEGRGSTFYFTLPQNG